MRKSGAFSLAFDGWTTFKGNSLVGVNYRFLDRDNKVREYLLDAIPLDRSHSAAYLATSILNRMNGHSTDQQILFSSATDGASAVRKASKLLCSKLEDMRIIFEETKHDDLAECVGPPQTFSDRVAALSFESDNAEVDRAVHCVAHNLDLTLREATKNVPQLSDMIDRIQSTSRVFKRNKEFRDLVEAQVKRLRSAGEKAEFLSMKLGSETRWNSCLPMLKSYVAMFRPITFVLVGLFSAKEMGEDDPLKSLTAFSPLSTAEFSEIREFVKILDRILLVSLFFQRTSLIIPFVREAIAELYFELHSLSSSIQFSVCKEFLKAFCSSLKTRFQFFFEPCHPATAAAILFPLSFINSVGLQWDCELESLPLSPFEAVMDLVNLTMDYMTVWHTYILPPPKVDTLPAPPKNPFSPLLSAGSVVSSEISAEQTEAQFNRAIRKYLVALYDRQSELERKEKIYDLKTKPFEEELKKGHRICAEILRTPGMFNADEVALLQALFGLIYSTPASTAQTERVFSKAKFIDNYLRTSLDRTKLEMQVVVRVFLDVLEETDRAKEFFECLERWLSSPVDVYNMVCYKY